MIDNSRAYKRMILPFPGFEIDIQYSSNGELSILGNCHTGGKGQCISDFERYMYNTVLNPSSGFNRGDIELILIIWKRWHLNNKRAGTQRQMDYLRQNRILPSSYDEDCALLEGAGLLIDNGYRYGTQWLRECVPESVLQYLFSLPAITGDTWKDMQLIEFDEKEFIDILMRKG